MKRKIKQWSPIPPISTNITGRTALL